MQRDKRSPRTAPNRRYRAVILRHPLVLSSKLHLMYCVIDAECHALTGVNLNYQIPPSTPKASAVYPVDPDVLTNNRSLSRVNSCAVAAIGFDVDPL